MTSCLDSWAILRWLEGAEPAASRVDQLLVGRPVMSWINLGEVLYILHRQAGGPVAHQVVEELRPRLALDLPGPDRVMEAARIRASHAVAYADAFAVATALAHGAVLVSGDREILSANPSWPTEDVS